MSEDCIAYTEAWTVILRTEWGGGIKLDCYEGQAVACTEVKPHLVLRKCTFTVQGYYVYTYSVMERHAQDSIT